MNRPMMGHLEASASAIAVSLVQGGKAEVVGEKWLQGVPLRYMEIDGVPVPTPDSWRKETPGVRVTHGDGSVSLYVMTNKTRAENLLERANEIAESLRG